MQRMQVLRKEMLDEIFPSRIWTKLRSCHHRTKRKHLRVFLGLWREWFSNLVCPVKVCIWPFDLWCCDGKNLLRIQRWTAAPLAQTVLFGLRWFTVALVWWSTKGTQPCCPPSSQSLLSLPLLPSEVPAVAFSPWFKLHCHRFFTHKNP